MLILTSLLGHVLLLYREVCNVRGQICCCQQRADSSPRAVSSWLCPQPKEVRTVCGSGMRPTRGLSCAQCRILEALIPVRLHLGQLPSEALLERHGLAKYYRWRRLVYILERLQPGYIFKRLFSAVVLQVPCAPVMLRCSTPPWRLTASTTFRSVLRLKPRT